MSLDWDSPEVERAFRDPIWRISNLYKIRVRDGSVIPFRPRPQQLEAGDDLPERMEANHYPEVSADWIQYAFGSALR